MTSQNKSVTVILRHDDALGLFRGENGEVFGGMETRAFMIAGALAKSGKVDMRVVAPESAGALHYPGVEFATLRQPIRRGVPLLSRRLNRLRALEPYAVSGPAAQLAFIAGTPSLERPLRVAQETGIPVVGTLSCDADIAGTFVEPEGRDYYFSLLRRLDAVIAQTQIQQQRLRSELGLESTLVPSLVAVDERPVAAGNYVLWVGRAAAIKRPWLFIELARALPQYEFVMAMLPHDQMLWDPLVAEVDRIPNLAIIPGVSYFDMPDLYRRAALLVGTSSVEGFPNVYLQAAAHAVPTVSLSVPTSIFEQSGGCGRNAVGDFSGFTDLVRTLMDNEAARRSVGVEAYDYVRDVHSVVAVTPILEELFTRVAR